MHGTWLGDKERLKSIVDAKHPDLVSRFRAVAAAFPHHPAVSFLVRGEEIGESCTFAGMDRRARALAGLFQQKGAAGRRAIVLFEAGVEIISAFLGCVYAGVIAAPLPAPLQGSVERYLARVSNVSVDGDIAYVLTMTPILEKLRDMAANMPGLQSAEWIAVDTLDPALADQWIPPAVDERDLCYLQYTSGSTSNPKGVMITHRNLTKIIEYNGAIMGYVTNGTATVCWMPYFHDFGLIEGLLIPLAHGMPVYLMSPLDFVQRPVRWLNAIHRFRASHSSGPNFAFDLCVRKTTAEERAVLDLSCWRRANTAAEPIRSATIDLFIKTFAPHGFDPPVLSPGWGLAEATLVVTAAERGAVLYHLDASALEQNTALPARDGHASRTLVNCGKVLAGDWDVEVKVVIPETGRELRDGEIGEVWVAGDLVAAGYWNHPAKTEHTFGAHVEGDPERRYLRTGDLGFMDKGELVFTGRRKDLIIVEGRNHYPQEIEKTAEAAHAALRPGCSIAFSVETEAQPRLVLVCELNRGYLLEGMGAPEQASVLVHRAEIERAIRREVSEEHQLRVHEVVLIPAGLIPKTTSGKLQRSGCKAKYLRGELALEFASQQ